MVPTDRLALFVVASVSLILVPRPSVGFVVATTLRHGRRAGLDRVSAGVYAALAAVTLTARRAAA